MLCSTPPPGLVKIDEHKNVILRMFLQQLLLWCRMLPFACKCIVRCASTGAAVSNELVAKVDDEFLLSLERNAVLGHRVSS